ncbi:MAG: DUF1015 domain-containing protein [Oscillospiraceae bacterium]
MAIIKPFKAMRFTDQKNTKQLTCPPYDIVSPTQRKQYIKANPYNIIRLELPMEGGEQKYQIAGSLLKEWLNEGVLACDNKDGYYIYEEEFIVNGEIKAVKGIVCRAMLYEFDEQMILPHEETLSKAKTDRFNLVSATECNLSSIYSLYFDENGSVEKIIDKISQGIPEICFTDDEQVTHRLWIVTNEQICNKISELMKDKKFYIADGHHRYETSLNYRRHLKEQGINVTDEHSANYIMMTLVAMEDKGLVVFPTHRIIKDLPNFNLNAVLDKCEEYFSVCNIKQNEAANVLDKAYNDGKKAFVLVAPQSSTLLTLKENALPDTLFEGKSDAYKQLDVAILHNLILEKLFGIDKENMANQKNLIYTRSAEEAVAEVENGTANCAFLINPTRVEEIAAVSAAGEKMPQKSTYFYPKLITGLVMNKF